MILLVRSKLYSDLEVEIMFRSYLNLIRMLVIFIILTFFGYMGWRIAWEFNMTIRNTLISMIVTSMFSTTLLLWSLNYIKGLILDFIGIYIPMKKKKKIRNTNVEQGVDPTSDQIITPNHYTMSGDRLMY